MTAMRVNTKEPMDIATYFENHFVTPAGKTLPLLPRWDAPISTSVEYNVHCEACGDEPENGKRWHLRHRLVVGELKTCRRCSFVLNGSDPGADLAKVLRARPTLDEVAMLPRDLRIRVVEMLLSDPRNQSSPAAAHQIFTPIQGLVALVEPDPHDDGAWSFTVRRAGFMTGSWDGTKHKRLTDIVAAGEMMAEFIVEELDYRRAELEYGEGDPDSTPTNAIDAVRRDEDFVDEE